MQVSYHDFEDFQACFADLCSDAATENVHPDITHPGVVCLGHITREAAQDLIKHLDNLIKQDDIVSCINTYGVSPTSTFIFLYLNLKFPGHFNKPFNPAKPRETGDAEISKMQASAQAKVPSAKDQGASKDQGSKPLKSKPEEKKPTQIRRREPMFKYV